MPHQPVVNWLYMFTFTKGPICNPISFRLLLYLYLGTKVVLSLNLV
jgi:hypothetical protein